LADVRGGGKRLFGSGYIAPGVGTHQKKGFGKIKTFFQTPSSQNKKRKKAEGGRNLFFGGTRHSSAPPDTRARDKHPTSNQASKRKKAPSKKATLS